jgi:two-component system, chemotaxis family, protein-glutamate methylesterase/glutaminase
MPFEVVGIGASGGGISALQIVVRALPSDFAAAVLVVQHLSPSFRSHLSEILRREAALPVTDAVEGMLVTGGTIVTAPPDHHVGITDMRVTVRHTATVRFSRPSIDVMLESIAAAYGARAIGVVLTGWGSDGAIGMQAIKRHGGTTLIEDPSTAERGSMPAAAWATDCIDFRLPLAEIGPMLAHLVGRTHAAS